jgi:CRP/FNR family cyclic AMP-dependent transcriptional regulator
MAQPSVTAHVPGINLFLEQCHKRKYPARSTIIYAGDAGDSLFFIVSGSVSVVIEDENGHEMVVAYLNPGDFFGEMGLFEEKPIRTAWIKAKNTCEVAEISYQKFKEVARQDAGLIFALSAQLAGRLRATTRKVSDLAFLDVTGRVAHALLELSKEPDAVTHPEGKQIKTTRQEIARIVGCSREMAGRVLVSLEEQGLITVKGKTMVILATP